MSDTKGVKKKVLNSLIPSQTSIHRTDGRYDLPCGFFGYVPRLHFYQTERGRGWDIQMSRSDSSCFPQCSVCLKLHWLVPS